MRFRPVITLAVLLGVHAARADTFPLPRPGRSFSVRVETTAGDNPPVVMTIHRKVVGANGETATIHNTFDELPPGTAGIVPSPDNLTTMRSFLLVATSIRTRAANAPTDAPPELRTYQLDCDDALLRSFFPIGHIPSVTMTCNAITTAPGRSPQANKVEMTIAWEGAATVDTPIGHAEVQDIRVTLTQPRSKIETTYRFDEARGLTLASEQTVSSGDPPRLVNRLRSEIVSIDP